MTRKRYIKLLMANGWSRNNAENTAGIVSHRGCWPYSTYVKAYDNMMCLRELYPSDKPGEGVRDDF